MIKARFFCLPLEACILCGNNLFKTENAVLFFKGEKGIYTFDVTVRQRKGIAVSAECSVNLRFVEEWRAQALHFVFSTSGRCPLTTEG